MVLTRDPVADRIKWVVVAALARTRRHLVSELELSVAVDGIPSDCFVNFDIIHTLPHLYFDGAFPRYPRDGWRKHEAS
jgi:mRNA-degrading endonuclease toxin of MazEF toxin-antitoxin module